MWRRHEHPVLGGRVESLGALVELEPGDAGDQRDVDVAVDDSGDGEHIERRPGQQAETAPDRVAHGRGHLASSPPGSSRRRASSSV